jgi:arsenite-transporting ATPase
MKSIFFTGKGGVGKSTLASAVGWQLAEKGYRVLATSFDPAHNLGDIFGLKLEHKRKRFKKSNLWLQETDLEKSANDYINANIGLLDEMYNYTKAFNMDRYFKVLKYSPGVEEYAALTSLETILREESQNFDYIVFDTPPTGLTLRILALPKITLGWLDRLITIRREILDKRYTIHNITGKYDEEGMKLPYTEEDDTVMRKLYDMQERYTRVRNVLESGDTSIAVVCNPDYLSFRESERLFDGLLELNLPLRVVLNNKVTPDTQENAERVERDLLKGRTDMQVERVELIDDSRPTCYIMDRDLTGSFIDSATPEEGA